MSERRIIIVGSGPVGLRCISELEKQEFQDAVTCFGGEEWLPYNRVRLSEFVSGAMDIDELELPRAYQDCEWADFQLNRPITHIDRENHCVTTDDGESYPYSKLVLAVGASAHMPNIEGMKTPGVYSFRDLNDAQTLLSRRTRAQQVVVIGGGLLGIEAARAMRVFNTQVTIIEHSTHLMYSQLDLEAGGYLLRYIESQNIEVLTERHVTRIQGRDKVESLLLDNGQEIPCDTLIVAAGIHPNVALAREAGLKVHRGIIVNDALQTSDPNIYAIGDCAEHNEIVYGLVGPGYEQAAVAAAHVCGKPVNYQGSMAATSLKVAGCEVFSIGDVDRMRDTGTDLVYEDGDSEIYRRLLVDRDRVWAAVAIGPWVERQRIQDAVLQKRRVWPWSLWRFRKEGDLWNESDEIDVSTWPHNAIICNCMGVTRGQLTHSIGEGCSSIECLAKGTGASTVCGSCKGNLQNLLGSSAAAEPVTGWRWLSGFSLLGLMIILVYLVWPGVAMQESVISPWQWDKLWRDDLYRQITGFSLLGVAVLISLISLRKRFTWLRLGEYASWRLVHVVLGVLAAVILLIHTGAHLGENLNFYLMFCFVGLMLAGIALSGMMSVEHHMSTGMASRVRKSLVWAHIILLWPVPILLAFHILNAYYFSS